MVEWTTVAASVGLSGLSSLVVAFVVTEYRLRREQSVERSVEVSDWYEDSAAYAAQVRRTWQRLFDSPDRAGMNLSEIQGELSLLEGQISRHASAGEQLGANQEVIDALDTLAEECRRVDDRPLHMDSLSEFEELREDILAAAGEVEHSLNDR